MSIPLPVHGHVLMIVNVLLKGDDKTDCPEVT